MTLKISQVPGVCSSFSCLQCGLNRLFLGSITCASQSGIGPTKLFLANRLSKGNTTTSSKQSAGQRNTILRLSSIFTGPLEVKMGTQRLVPPNLGHLLTVFSMFQVR